MALLVNELTFVSVSLSQFDRQADLQAIGGARPHGGPPPGGASRFGVAT